MIWNGNLAELIKTLKYSNKTNIEIDCAGSPYYEKRYLRIYNFERFLLNYGVQYSKNIPEVACINELKLHVKR